MAHNDDIKSKLDSNVKVTIKKKKIKTFIDL